MSRLHVVLVPGFAGFDALGQLEYYAGVTPLFREWQARAKRPKTTLHYFDNFPTAGVATRAERLRRYLAKRIVRGEFQRGDSVVLVGHSTGGLDIRRLAWVLWRDRDEPIVADGAQVACGDVLEMVRRAVFLSAPHFGTNIAHWVRENWLGRQAVVAYLRGMVGTSQVPLANRLEEALCGATADALGLDLLRAMRDALRDAEERAGGDPIEIAGAHEAASQLELWLRHIASDFAAIDDLLPRESKYSFARENPAARGYPSPAQFGAAERSTEESYWRKIETLSFATRSNSPFQFTGAKAPEWRWLEPWTWPDLTRRSEASEGTDGAYRWCYRACAGGPFELPDDPRPAKLGVRAWDNDGIVNTASMLWPRGAQLRMLECDHADIIGHFESARGGGVRRYDLLGSASAFAAEDFKQVWDEVFDFCAGRQASAAGA